VKAAVQDRYGSPDVLRIDDVPTPVPGDREVLVRVHAATVGATDSIARRGVPAYARLFFGLRRPRIPILGSDFAGQVEAVGPGVTRFAVCDQVSGTTGPGFRAHAQYVCLSENAALATKPAGVSYPEAAALVDATALSFLRDKARLRAGQTILVNGASGSVGTAAVQLATHLGADVTGVCGGANLELVRRLGAGTVIDYTREDFTRSGRTYDVVFDAVGKSSFSRCRASLNRGGVYLTTGASLAILLQAAWTARIGHRRAAIAFTGLRPASEKTADLLFVKELVEAGRIVPVVDRTYPLNEIAEAHRYVDQGHKKGNVVVT
jgi:NADPH:quinone reductase-like Zn-dependent oxidoreductase